MSFDSPPLFSLPLFNITSLLFPFYLHFHPFHPVFVLSFCPLLCFAIFSYFFTFNTLAFFLSVFRPFRSLTNYPAVPRKHTHTSSSNSFHPWQTLNTHTHTQSTDVMRQTEGEKQENPSRIHIVCAFQNLSSGFPSLFTKQSLGKQHRVQYFYHEDNLQWHS